MKVTLFTILFGALFALSGVAHAQSSTIAVLNFENKAAPTYVRQNAVLGSQISESITTLLAGRGEFDVVERERLQAAIQELGLAHSGLADNTRGIARLGELLVVQYLILGSIQEQDCIVKSFNGYGIRSQMRECRLSLTYRMVDVNTGKVIFGDIAEATRTSQVTNSGGTVDTGLWRAMALEVGRDVADRLAERIAPKPDTTGVEYVKSSFGGTPSGASVVIDGIMFGTTPTTVEVARGIHLVRIELAGYEAWSQQVMITEGSQFAPALHKIREADLVIEVK